MQMVRMMHIENIEIMGWRGVALTPVPRVRIPLGSPGKNKKSQRYFAALFLSIRFSCNIFLKLRADGKIGRLSGYFI